MLKLHAFLNRKPSSLLPPPCQVEAVVELDAVSFENLLQIGIQTPSPEANG